MQQLKNQQGFCSVFVLISLHYSLHSSSSVQSGSETVFLRCSESQKISIFLQKLKINEQRQISYQQKQKIKLNWALQYHLTSILWMIYKNLNSILSHQQIASIQMIMMPSVNLLINNPEFEEAHKNYQTTAFVTLNFQEYIFLYNDSQFHNHKLTKIIVQMNIKRACFGLGVESSLNRGTIASNQLNPISKQKKQKTKIGEEIRKKTKINIDLVASYSREEKQNIKSSNNVRIHNCYENDKSGDYSLFQSLVNPKERSLINPKERRTPMMNRSMEVSSCTSSKSVRFSDKHDKQGETSLKRQSSTSSILKNGSSSMMKKSVLSQKGSLNNSICSNILKEEQSSQKYLLNKSLKQKYDRLNKTLQKNKTKYCDELYPPLWSSLSRMNLPQFKQIKWKRIGDVFAGKQLSVWQPETKMTICPGQFSKSRVISNCFNTIKHNNFLLQKMFESQKYNPGGIYYVKINQNNTWKYVIIDDYVPVCLGEDAQTQQCAFMHVYSSQANKCVQIWPFLLQKAYAKFYSTYQCLDKGCQIDFLQQITGCPIERISVCPEKIQKIHEELRNSDTILFARSKKGRIYPLIPRKQQIVYEDPSRNYSQAIISSDLEFITHFQQVACIFLHKFYVSNACTIKYNLRGNTEQHISIRNVRLEEHTECVFNLCQKDSKHYADKYSYTWMRMLVVMKEGPKNYRWIDGAYNNCKNISLCCSLDPGDYYIVLIPEWEGRKGFDFSLQFYGNTQCTFQRTPYKGNQYMITEAAMDLAQTHGTLKQLNQNICTYSYIDRKVGFIIESINNERPHGHVRVMRSIQGLQRPDKKMVQAFNIEFREQKSVQVKIDSLSHFTVVLGVIGGIDYTFLNKFDFGC